MDTLRIFFGVYTDYALGHPGLDPADRDNIIKYKKKDRITLFLWPYHGQNQAVYNSGKKTTPVPPYNLGDINPKWRRIKNGLELATTVFLTNLNLKYAFNQ